MIILVCLSRVYLTYSIKIYMRREMCILLCEIERHDDDFIQTNYTGEILV